LTLTIILPHASWSFGRGDSGLWCCSRPRELLDEYAFHRGLPGAETDLSCQDAFQFFDWVAGSWDQLVSIATLGAMNFAHPGYLCLLCKRGAALAFPVTRHIREHGTPDSITCCRDTLVGRWWGRSFRCWWGSFHWPWVAVTVGGGVVVGALDHRGVDLRFFVCRSGEAPTWATDAADDRFAGVRLRSRRAGGLSDAGCCRGLPNDGWWPCRAERTEVSHATILRLSFN